MQRRLKDSVETCGCRLTGKANAVCPSRMGRGTDSQLPISTQVSNCFPESQASACVRLKEWKTNALGTNVLPPSCCSFYCRVPCQMAQNSPLASQVSCPAQGKQGVSLLVLTSLQGESGFGAGRLDLLARCNHHLCSLLPLLLLQPPHCNPALLLHQQQNLLF